jgi:hypothetical protein
LNFNGLLHCVISQKKELSWVFLDCEKFSDKPSPTGLVYTLQDMLSNW